MTYDLVCLGALLLDMFPGQLGCSVVEVPAWHPKPGGAPANVAVAAARLGARSAFIGQVGDDLFGHYLARVLADNGVDVRGVRYDAEARTTLTFHAKPDVNTAEFLFYRNPGADTRLRAEELDRDLLRQTAALHFDTLALSAEPGRTASRAALDLACAAGALISFDVNYRPSLWSGPDAARAAALEVLPRAHLLKVNEIELALLAGTDDPDAGSARLAALGPELVVITLGPDGSYFRCAGGHGLVPPYRVEAVDAIGCGDAFIAALLTRLVAKPGWRTGGRHLDPAGLAETLRYANAVGALTATVEGVIPALPSAAQVAAFLASYQE